jgi:hypothetical protein
MLCSKTTKAIREVILIVVSKKLRDSAKGRQCTLRLSVCNFNTETTVLAHLPIGLSKGMGIKGNDNHACFACSSCHDLLDGRTKGFVSEKDMLRALYETQTIWIEEGLITIEGFSVSWR